ncbi:MAG: hypothetical protein LBK12_06385 [Odoribacteraceae bacterium]|jgi:hypothetical protein|nr:hypothetical protein [Odoribacteraceae bacterium]
MKTTKNRLNTIIAAVLASCAASCVTEFKMITTIHPGGRVSREVSAEASREFQAGDTSRNPFMFRLDDGWQVTFLDRGDKRSIARASRSGDLRAMTPREEMLRPLAAPVETLEKRFRWFYTYYTFRAVYPSIEDKIPVAAVNMSDEQRRYWFQGDDSALRGMNGWEWKRETDEIENEFLVWYARNLLKVYLDIIREMDPGADNPSPARLDAARDTLLLLAIKDGFPGTWDTFFDEEEIVTINRLLDGHFKTTRFSRFFEQNKERVNAAREQRMLLPLFEKEIEYNLVLPGKLIDANAPVTCGDTLAWRVTALRLVPGDYTLTATSREAHAWAFAVPVILLIVSACCFAWAQGKGRK